MRRAFSLLEVLLALAIFAGSLAVLGEIARQALRNAEYARDTTRATLLCESKMAELTASVTAPDAVQGAPLETDEDDRPWLYSVDNQQVDDLGLLAVTVSVTLASESGGKTPTASLTRWMIDTTLNLSSGTSSDTSGSSGSSSSGSSSSGTGSK